MYNQEITCTKSLYKGLTSDEAQKLECVLNEQQVIISTLKI